MGFDPGGGFRMVVEDVFTIRKRGPVLTASSFVGPVPAVGDTVALLQDANVIWTGLVTTVEQPKVGGGLGIGLADLPDGWGGRGQELVAG